MSSLTCLLTMTILHIFLDNMLEIYLLCISIFIFSTPFYLYNIPFWILPFIYTIFHFGFYLPRSIKIVMKVIWVPLLLNATETHRGNRYFKVSIVLLKPLNHSPLSLTLFHDIILSWFFFSFIVYLWTNLWVISIIFLGDLSHFYGFNY
jgi:hypothetical protein